MRHLLVTDVLSRQSRLTLEEINAYAGDEVTESSHLKALNKSFPSNQVGMF